MRHYPVFLFLLSGWAVQMLLAVFAPWIVLPDILVVMMVYLYFHAPTLPIWRYLLPVSLLADMAASVWLGFHGLLYTIMAFALFPMRRFWIVSSTFEQIAAMIVTSVCFVILKFLLFYLVMRVPAISGWYGSILAQLLIWPIINVLTSKFIMRFIPREHE